MWPRRIGPLTGWNAGLRPPACKRSHVSTRGGGASGKGTGSAKPEREPSHAGHVGAINVTVRVWVGRKPDVTDRDVKAEENPRRVREDVRGTNFPRVKIYSQLVVTVHLIIVFVMDCDQR